MCDRRGSSQRHEAPSRHIFGGCCPPVPGELSLCSSGCQPGAALPAAVSSLGPLTVPREPTPAASRGSMGRGRRQPQVRLPLLTKGRTPFARTMRASNRCKSALHPGLFSLRGARNGVQIINTSSGRVYKLHIIHANGK